MAASTKIAATGLSTDQLEFGQPAKLPVKEPPMELD